MELMEITVCKPPTFVDDIFGSFSRIKSKLAYASLRKELDQLVSKVKGLEEFGVPAGDPRYVQLKSRVTTSLNLFLSKNPTYNLHILEADIPALEYVAAMAEQPEVVVSRVEQIQAQAGKVLSIVLVAGVVLLGLALVLLPPVIAAIHHYYAWWMKVL